MHQPPTPPPSPRHPGEDDRRKQRDDRVDDRRHRVNHPDDDRLTEADLDRNETDRRSTHAGTGQPG
jgi:hypothetical protein